MAVQSLRNITANSASKEQAVRDFLKTLSQNIATNLTQNGPRLYRLVRNREHDVY